MKEVSENEKLLADVLSEDGELQASTLRAGLTALRHKRRRRCAVQVLFFALAPLAGAAAMIFLRQPPRRELARQPEVAVAAVQTNRTIEGTTIRVLTDEELLAFFKGRPVALIGSPGRQRLVLFDERRNR